jgi:hypothetical protein
MPEFEGFWADVNFLRFPEIEPRRRWQVRFDALSRRRASSLSGVLVR